MFRPKWSQNDLIELLPKNPHYPTTCLDRGATALLWVAHLIHKPDIVQIVKDGYGSKWSTPNSWMGFPTQHDQKSVGQKGTIILSQSQMSRSCMEHLYQISRFKSRSLPIKHREFPGVFFGQVSCFFWPLNISCLSPETLLSEWIILQIHPHWLTSRLWKHPKCQPYHMM